MNREDQREYDNAIKYIASEFLLTNNIHINQQSFNNIPQLRQIINDFFTIYSNKVPNNVNEKLDLILQYELGGSKIMDVDALLKYNKWPISLIKHDITTMFADCIVNAANSKGLGCFIQGHKCIDNVIHSKAGPRMREECKINLNNKEIEPGNLIITLGYNLPSRYVFHTVGPIYDSNKVVESRITLIKCYLNCMKKLSDIKKQSIVFCCISTGEYGYPKNEACIIAIGSIKRWLNENKDYNPHITFCVYSDEDYNIYKKNMIHMLS